MGDGERQSLLRAERRRESSSRNSRRSSASSTGSVPAASYPERAAAAAKALRENTLRSKLWLILHYRHHYHGPFSKASRIVEGIILCFIVLNVIFAIKAATDLDTPVEDELGGWYETFLIVSTVVFTTEYLLRLYSCAEDERFSKPCIGRLRWMTKPISMLDLICLFPFYLEILVDLSSEDLSPSYRGATTIRGLRLLRLISFFRVERYYNALRKLRRVFYRKKAELVVLVYVVCLIVLVASVTIFFLENSTQPDKFDNILNAAWWAIETITSVGYGDLTPVTPLGKIFGAMVALMGVVLFSIPIGIVSSGFVEIMLETEHEERERKELAMLHAAAYASSSQIFFEEGITPHIQNDIDTEGFHYSRHGEDARGPSSFISDEEKARIPTRNYIDNSIHDLKRYINELLESNKKEGSRRSPREGSRKSGMEAKDESIANTAESSDLSSIDHNENELTSCSKHVDPTENMRLVSRPIPASYSGSTASSVCSLPSDSSMDVSLKAQDKLERIWLLLSEKILPEIAKSREELRKISKIQAMHTVHLNLLEDQLTSALRILRRSSEEEFFEDVESPEDVSRQPSSDDQATAAGFEGRDGSLP